MSQVETTQITETNRAPLATHRDGDVVLRDGSTVRVRVMRPKDEELLFALFKSLSADSRWLRFMSAASDSALAAEAHREARVDYCRKFGLIALTGHKPDEKTRGLCRAQALLNVVKEVRHG